jgi:hypothetical protein
MAVGIVGSAGSDQGVAVGQGQGDALYASVSPAQLGSSSIGTVEGLLVNYRAVGMMGDNGKRYVHNITLYNAGSRKYIKCAFWADKVIDIRPLMSSAVTFYWSYVKAARDAKYGTDIGGGLPAVVFNGSLHPSIMKQYESDLDC